MILIQPIKVSNNKSFLQRKICAEVWVGTAGLKELLLLISAGTGSDFLFGALSLVGMGRPSAASRVHKIEINPKMCRRREKAKWRTFD